MVTTILARFSAASYAQMPTCPCENFHPHPFSSRADGTYPQGPRPGRYIAPSNPEKANPSMKSLNGRWRLVVFLEARCTAMLVKVLAQILRDLCNTSILNAKFCDGKSGAREARAAENHRFPMSALRSVVKPFQHCKSIQQRPGKFANDN